MRRFVSDLLSPSLFSLSGRLCLVTGASGGLGLHFARVLHAAGGRVILAARRAEKIAAAAAALGERAHAVPMDVADEHAVAAAFRTIDGIGVCDIVINNAGIAATGAALGQSGDDWDRVLDVDLRGAFLVARESARRMADAGVPGSIVNIASILGVRPLNGVASYSAAKAGLLQLTRSLAVEWARNRIRVNALAPGYIATDINAEFFAGEAGQAMVRRIPQRRLGTMADLTGPLLLLASEAGAHMTGAVVTVDGGHSVSGL